MNATTTIFINRFKPNANGLCVISLRVTANRIRKYYPSGVSMGADDFDMMMASKTLRGKMKDRKEGFEKLEIKARDIIKKLPVFSFEEFEKHFIENKGLSDTVNSAFDNYIEQLNSENRIGSAVAYRATKKSLNIFFAENKVLPKTIVNEKTFRKEPASDYTFFHVTVSMLKKYEQWMYAQGNSSTTVGIYMRSLRAIFNIAIADGLVSKDFYPFGKRKYEIPKSRNTKKALTLAQIQSIYNYQAAPGSTTERMLDYWIFIYFCNGLNVKDMAKLRYKNMQGDFLHFLRSKTEFTKNTTEEIRVPLNDVAKAIIKKYGNKAINQDAYIFPILQPGITAQREYELIQQATGLINDHMKLVAAELGINAKVTTYVARHSFSTVLKRSGASIEYISEALGHSDIKTTQNYLASFEDDTKKQTNSVLANFEMTRKIENG
jgi:site-specific recombinase XerD